MTDRTVRVCDNGARVVATYHEGRSSWRAYFIYPRELIVARLKKLRASGRKRNDIEFWEMLPDDPVPRPSLEGGPGLPYAKEPVRLRFRKHIVFSQHGGLDI